ncbi:TPA: hypothetical protein ACX6RM_001307 [Photobacterium damselae]
MSNNVAHIRPSGYNHSNNDGDPPMSLEPRVAKLESDVEYIKRDISDVKTDIREIRQKQERDFRFTFGAIITAAIGLAGLMAKGFNWI